ncbi:YdcH family protein [Sphingopyxis terrae subsp. ummariensis]
MSHTPHELADAFPGDAAAIHRLKEGDAHFAALAERYHVVNRAIHRAESEVEPVSDEHAEELKRQRLALLDEIGAIIAAERTA